MKKTYFVTRLTPKEHLGVQSDAFRSLHAIAGNVDQQRTYEYEVDDSQGVLQVLERDGKDLIVLVGPLS